MLQFLQPAWLWMASAIVVPVLIHLWNIREGKTLKIGSVLLLQQSARQHARSFRIREWLLLLLRCLLVVLLALLLAEPAWFSQPRAVQQKGWVVLEKANRQELYRVYGKEIDSLLRAGLELHYFATGFPLVKREELSQAAGSAAADTSSYWTYARQLTRRLPSGLPVYLYTGNQLTRFAGKRPELPANLHWQLTTPADSVSGWLAAAFLTRHDSIRVIKAASDPARLGYTAENIAGSGAAAKGYTTSFEKGKLLLSVTGNPQAAPVEADTATMRVVVFADTYKQDALYLQAAIRAIQQYSHRRIELQLISDPSGIPSPPHWLFWLSDRPVPLIANCNTFRYAAGKERHLASWLLQEDVESAGEPIALYKTVYDSTADPDNDIIWHDGYGQPVLTKTRVRQGRLYNFYSRFNPQWTDLPWSSRFPAWMLQLLLEQNKTIDIQHDKRALTQQQLAAAAVPAKENKPAATPLEKADLWKGFWAAAFFIFFLERFLSYKNKKQPG